MHSAPERMYLALLLIATGCGSRAAAPEDPAARSASPTPVASEPAAGDGLTELEGQWAFNFYDDSLPCAELTAQALSELRAQKAVCKAREPGESFGIDRGVWHSCELKGVLLGIYPSQEICVEMYETQQANSED